ncbi:Hypothetical predicted protein, partial [Paramuricea clavata]
MTATQCSCTSVSILFLMLVCFISKLLEAKRKLPHEENCRARKIPRLAKDVAVTNEQSDSLSFFQKVTKFVGSFWPSSFKENNPLDNNTTTGERKNGPNSHSSINKSRISSAVRSATRSSPRRRRQRHRTTNNDSRMLQQLHVTSPLRRSPRVVTLHSPKK